MDKLKFAIMGGLQDDAITPIATESLAALNLVKTATGAGNDFLGWVNLPAHMAHSAETAEIKAVADDLRHRCDVVVCIGIGGSYLGAKAVIEAMRDPFEPTVPEVVFAGQNIGEDYLYDLLHHLEGKKFGIIVISKSGTTTEPAIAFRILKEQLERNVGKAEASKLIVAITDEKKGALRTLAQTEGYRTFVIPDNVGGRFSVLTPVGLLPIAVAGFDIDALLDGAEAMQHIAAKDDNMINPSLRYAEARNSLYRDGRKIEILVNYDPRLHYVGEWWKQLYGESEGKDGKGIFPAAVDFSTDLHSMGQWIQDGERTIFETVISIGKPRHTIAIPTDGDNLDGLNFIAERRIDEVNKMAEIGTRLAHLDGNVPQLHIELPELNEYWLGQLLYFFEMGCGISGYILGVNPFDQPGVEAYKKNMFALLGKPGYEEATKQIRQRLND